MRERLWFEHGADGMVLLPEGVPVVDGLGDVSVGPVLVSLAEEDRHSTSLQDKGGG